ncbi:unnamed protein product, partial [Rotaria socialis]
RSWEEAHHSNGRKDIESWWTNQLDTST